MDQKLLIYGKIIQSEISGSKVFKIKPKFLIGSGLVEMEEILEYSKMKINAKLFNIMAVLAMVSLLHFTYKLLFVDKQKLNPENRKL